MLIMTINLKMLICIWGFNDGYVAWRQGNIPMHF